jgi:hypothetical protein
VQVIVKIRPPQVTAAKFGIVWVALALVVSPACAQQKPGGKFPRFCLTIAVQLRPGLRERVSVVDLVIENASVVAVPRFPPGWEFKIENRVDVSPSRIFGGATGSVAELAADDLKCLFEVEDSVPGTPPIKVTGSVYISTGEHERRISLDRNHIVLERITARGGP